MYITVDSNGCLVWIDGGQVVRIECSDEIDVIGSHCTGKPPCPGGHWIYDSSTGRCVADCSHEDPPEIPGSGEEPGDPGPIKPGTGPDKPPKEKEPPTSLTGLLLCSRTASGRELKPIVFESKPSAGEDFGNMLLRWLRNAGRFLLRVLECGGIGGVALPVDDNGGGANYGVPDGDPEEHAKQAEKTLMIVGGVVALVILILLMKGGQK